MSLWDNVWDSACDLVGYTESERKRDEYKKAVDKLNGYNSIIESYISECREAYKGFALVHSYGIHTHLNGEIIELFKFRSEKIHQKNLSYITDLENAGGIIASRLAQAQSLYETYCDKCEAEEKAAKEAKEKETTQENN